jgi:hypothetical protein
LFCLFFSFNILHVKPSTTAAHWHLEALLNLASFRTRYPFWWNVPRVSFNVKLNRDMMFATQRLRCCDTILTALCSAGNNFPWWRNATVGLLSLLYYSPRSKREVTRLTWTATVLLNSQCSLLIKDPPGVKVQTLSVLFQGVTLSILSLCFLPAVLASAQAQCDGSGPGGWGLETESRWPFWEQGQGRVWDKVKLFWMWSSCDFLFKIKIFSNIFNSFCHCLPCFCFSVRQGFNWCGSARQEADDVPPSWESSRGTICSPNFWKFAGSNCHWIVAWRILEIESIGFPHNSYIGHRTTDLQFWLQCSFWCTTQAMTAASPRVRSLHVGAGTLSFLHQELVWLDIPVSHLPVTTILLWGI